MTVRDRLQALLAETELSDPHEIAERIVADLGPRELRPALLEALPTWIRANFRTPSTPGGAIATTSTHRPDAPPGGSRSRKWESAAAALLRSPFRGADTYKPLREFTVADAEHAASERHSKAKEIAAWGDKFDRLAALLREKEAATVADLPEGDVVGVFS